MKRRCVGRRIRCSSEYRSGTDCPGTPHPHPEPYFASRGAKTARSFSPTGGRHTSCYLERVTTTRIPVQEGSPDYLLAEREERANARRKDIASNTPDSAAACQRFGLSCVCFFSFPFVALISARNSWHLSVGKRSANVSSFPK